MSSNNALPQESPAAVDGWTNSSVQKMGPLEGQDADLNKEEQDHVVLENRPTVENVSVYSKQGDSEACAASATESGAETTDEEQEASFANGADAAADSQDLEKKGGDSEDNKTKRSAMDRETLEADEDGSAGEVFGESKKRDRDMDEDTSEVVIETAAKKRKIGDPGYNWRMDCSKELIEEWEQDLAEGYITEEDLVNTIREVAEAQERRRLEKKAEVEAAVNKAKLENPNLTDRELFDIMLNARSAFEDRKLQLEDRKLQQDRAEVERLEKEFAEEAERERQEEAERKCKEIQKDCYVYDWDEYFASYFPSFPNNGFYFPDTDNDYIEQERIKDASPYYDDDNYWPEPYCRGCRYNGFYCKNCPGLYC